MQMLGPITLTCLCFVGGSLLADVAGRSSLSRSDLMALEARAWACKGLSLSSIEQQSVSLLQREPSSAFAHYILALVKLQRLAADPLDIQQAYKALELGRQSIALAPKREFGYVATAQVLEVLGFSLQAYETIHASPGGWRTALVKTMHSGGLTPEQKLKAYRKLALNTPESLDIVINPLVATLEAITPHNERSKLVVDLSEQIEHPEILHLLAKVFRRRGESKKARQTLAAAFQSGSNPNITISYVEQLLLERRYTAAKKIVGSLIATNNLTAEQRQSALAQASISHLEGKAKQQGLQYFRDIILTPNDFDSQFTVASVIEALSQATRKAHITAIAKLLSRHAHGRSELLTTAAEVMNKNPHELKLATGLLEHAIALDPKNFRIYKLLGIALYDLEQYSSALEALEIASKLNPFDASSLYVQACIYSIQNRLEMARSHLIRVVRLDPSYLDERGSNSEIRKLKKPPSFTSLINSMRRSGAARTEDEAHFDQ